MKYLNKNFTIYTQSILFASLLLLWMSSCNNDVESSADTPNEEAPDSLIILTNAQYEAEGMITATMDTVLFYNAISTSGNFDVPPKNMAMVSTFFNGFVKNIDLIPGQKVQKGQVLFTLEDPHFIEIQQEFLQTKSQIEYLESEYDRQKNLAESNVTSKKNFLKTKSDYNEARVKYMASKKKLAMMNINPGKLTEQNISSAISIYAPVSGYITEVHISMGMYVEAATTALTLIDTDHLHLELQVYEKDLPAIEKEQKVLFYTEGNPSREYEAKIHLINKAIDPVTRAISVHAHLTDENLNEGFMPGMYVNARILSTPKPLMALPEEAIITVEDEDFVLVKIPNPKSDEFQFVKKKVTTGMKSKGFIEIMNAREFSQKTEFLTKGAFRLISE